MPDYALKVRCDFCYHGWVDGPYIAPDVCEALECSACDGTGWVVVEYFPIEEADLDEAMMGLTPYCAGAQNDGTRIARPTQNPDDE